MITAAEIRKRFLTYFARQGHEVVASSPLVPRDDPTLYFTNAGMVQFKKLFLGQEKRGYSRAATSQKCLRISGKHNDLENVGRTARHHTFFEMLGNFSFGDYFKADAIRYAWEFITVDLGLPKDRLYVTVYTDDDEAHGLWQSVAGVPAERIFRLGEKDNFWSMGDTGPCGPCSEIYVDQGEAMSCGPDCGIGRCDCDRFLEIWNLVFMQFDQIEPGKRVPLPRPSIDTGMGLERIAAVCQGKTSNFECDLFQELIGFIGALAGVPYKSRDEESDVALRVIADHARSSAFLITDGVMPSNEGRSYELRRIIRRALRFGTLIGFKEAFLYKVCEKVAEVMGAAYPELPENKAFMAKVVREEEERFARTLGKGLDILAEELDRLKKAGAAVVPGDVCFKLYDTFGFPIDIVRDVAEKQGFSVDEPGFKVCMDQQKARARDAWKGSGEQDLAGRFAALLETGVTSAFTGYEELKTEAKLLAVLNDKGEPVEKLPQGQGGYVVAARTPFYAESGGQAGDTGVIESITGAADVLDTLKPAPELHVHKVFVSEGDLTRGQEATLTVSASERLATARNHTTTHLLHAALRGVLGDHVKQAGSLVGPDRLRFDFTHISAMTPDEIAEVEARVNEAILSAIPVSCEVMAVDKALEHGATALFGEKYGAEVRVVAVPGVSKELCGGTHLENTGQAGPFMILSESGVAAGVRRIEGATGLNALSEIGRLRSESAQAASLLKARPGELAERIGGLQKEIKTLQKEREQLQAKLLSGAGKGLMDDVREVNGVKLLTVDAPGMPVKALREQMDDIRSKMPSGVAALAAAQDDGKVSLILYVSKDLHGRFTAQSLIKDVSAKIGGSGGGRPDMAQAGGTDAAGIPAAFATLEELLGK